MVIIAAIGFLLPRLMKLCLDSSVIGMLKRERNNFTIYLIELICQQRLSASEDLPVLKQLEYLIKTQTN